MKTEADSLERIIAEMRQPENSGQFGPWQFTADNIKDWAGRLAALAKAREVTDADVERALDASDSYWNESMSDCDRCKGKGTHGGFGEDGHDQDWCEKCGGPGAVSIGTEAGAMRAALATFTEGESLRHVDHPDCNHCYSLWADKQEGEE